MRSSLVDSDARKARSSAERKKMEKDQFGRNVLIQEVSDGL